MSNKKQLKKHIEQLLIEAKELDDQRGKNTQALFDRRLFKCKARSLLPCAKEAMSTYKNLLTEQSRGTENLERIEHLSNHLINQINAIQRELATVQLRETELSGYAQQKTSLKALYQELIQHTEWERRLSEMVREKENAWNLASKQDKERANKSFILTEQRLIRCQKAKLAIESEIEQREKNND